MAPPNPWYLVPRRDKTKKFRKTLVKIDAAICLDIDANSDITGLLSRDFAPNRSLRNDHIARANYISECKYNDALCIVDAFGCAEALYRAHGERLERNRKSKGARYYEEARPFFSRSNDPLYIFHVRKRDLVFLDNAVIVRKLNKRKERNNKTETSPRKRIIFQRPSQRRLRICLYPQFHFGPFSLHRHNCRVYSRYCPR